MLAEERIVNRRREAVARGISGDGEDVLRVHVLAIVAVSREGAVERQLSRRGALARGDEGQLGTEERREDAGEETTLAHADDRELFCILEQMKVVIERLRRHRELRVRATVCAHRGDR